MLWRITIIVALAGMGAALGTRWVEDPLHRVILWGLWIWLLLESVEAFLSWNQHPWRAHVLAIWSLLKTQALAAMVLPMAFLLTGLGVSLIYTVVGRRSADDLWMLIGVLVILGAIAIATLAASKYSEKSPGRRS